MQQTVYVKSLLACIGRYSEEVRILIAVITLADVCLVLHVADSNVILLRQDFNLYLLNCAVTFLQTSDINSQIGEYGLLFRYPVINLAVFIYYILG